MTSETQEPRDPPSTLPLTAGSRVAPVITPADVPPARPGDLEDEWARRTVKALDMVDRGIDGDRPLGMLPDEYRARMVAVKLVLGAQRSALPLPTRRALGAGELELRDGDRAIRLRWANGQPVVLPLHEPHKPDEDEDRVE